MKKYIRIDIREKPKTRYEEFLQFLRRTFRCELFVGLWVVFRHMFKKSDCHTLMYPMEKFDLGPRYRGVHKLMRLLESEHERCIGCGLCAKICVSNCIRMDTHLGEDGRKKIDNYSINWGRCVYCGLCADVCPEIAIVHGHEYELSSEQRAYYGFKEDLLVNPKDNVPEFEGFGSIPENANKWVKHTPTSYSVAEKNEE